MLNVARWLGFLASAGTLGLYVIFVFFNPYAPTPLTAPIALMMLLAVAGMIAALAARPIFMLVIFAGLFIPVGFYMLGIPSFFRWIGLLNILLLASGLMALAARRRAQPAGARL